MSPEIQASITALVSRFLADSQRKRHNEDSLQEYYILPLFRLLGWNTESPAELVAEETIGGKRADYGFYLNGVPQFYVETKRLNSKEDITDRLRQAMNYSYMKGIAWAVLTDFERLYVIYAELEDPDPKKAVWFELGVDEYASPRGLERLWLLSKPAMQQRNIDQLAEDFNRKPKRKPIEEVLFNDLTDWRKRLFNDIRQQGSTLWASDSRQVDNAVQKLFDRLIFLRTLEDRGVEEPRLKQITRQDLRGNIFPKLLKLFTELDAVYNSNLFAHHLLDSMETHDPGLIREIVDGLYKQAGQGVEYDFKVMSADVLGAVYEQYLGFKANDPDAKTSGKTAKRKQQGIYYTPLYVVRYLVQHTLGRLLQDGADPHALKVLDPACGSGAFLIEAFDVLDRWLAHTEPDIPASERRERILKENLYGVDLDEQAVEVTRLNLVLRAAYERRKLPMLANIRHGNSLIHTDDVAGAGVGFDWSSRFPHLQVTGGFDVVIGNPPYVRQESLTAGFKGYAAERYTTAHGTADLYVYFVERGFELLRQGGRMGYILPNKWLRAGYGAPLRGFLQDKIEQIVDFGDLPVFPDATTYPLMMTLHNGITAAPTMTTVRELPPKKAAAALEHYFATPHAVKRERLTRNGWSLAPEAAATLIDRLQAAGVPLGEYVDGKIYYGIKTGYNEAFVIEKPIRDALIRADARSADLIKPFVKGREVKRYAPLAAEHWLICIPNGWTDAQMGADNRRGMIYHAPTAHPAPTDDPAWAWLEAHYPAIARHLAPYAVKAAARSDQGRYWWELRPCDYYSAFEQPKIIVPTIVNKPHASLDTSGFYSNDKTTIISSSDLYLLGILNSSIAEHFMKHIAATKQGGYFEYKPVYISQIPIPQIAPEDARYTAITRPVGQLLAQQATLAALDTTDGHNDDRKAELQEIIRVLEGQVNEAVAAAYGVDLP
jgi:hypothetical protein